MNEMDTVKWTGLAALAALLVANLGCVEVGLPAGDDQTHAPIWPIFDMHADPAFEDQQRQETGSATQPESMRYPPPETVSRTHRLTKGVGESEGAEQLANPVPITRDTLDYGKITYAKTCAPCHGTFGLGGGPVADAYARYDIDVPALANQRVQGYSDARIYRTISHGYGNMWSYKSQLKPMERWAVVNYLRALQRANTPEPWDRPGRAQ